MKINLVKQSTLLLMALVITTLLSGYAPGCDKFAALRWFDYSSDTLITFDNHRSGSIPEGWTGVLGNWNVLPIDGGKVLAQSAKNSGMDFNVAVLDGIGFEEVALSVDIRAISGVEDQGGGLVWRFIDEHNYYIVRFNPLENNFRLYKVLNGRRIQMMSANSSIPDGSWFNIRVEMSGSEIVCYLNEKLLLRHSDDTFTTKGKVGFWTKADAVSEFDNFKIKISK